MVTLRKIEEFLSSEPVAMIGVSRDPRKFGFTAFRELKEKGMNILPVNPYASEIHGAKVFKDIASLPGNVGGIIIMTKKDQTASVVREAKEKGISQIWIQQSCETPEAIREASDPGINLITKECILMHYKPHSIHKFHLRIRKFFRTFPK